MSTTAMTASRPPEAPLDRARRGRFAPGNAGGPGNPDARAMARLRELFRACVPDEVFHGLVARLVGLALKGHYPALKLALEYLAGKPERGVPADEVAVHEMDLALKRHDRERLCDALRVPTDAIVHPGEA